MKCPKCQYIGFDNADRCRNCGYDFSLSLDLPPADIPIQNGSEPLGPLADFALNDTPNLPLFVKDGDPDVPLVAPGGVPRPPLAVRRGTPTPRPKRDHPPSRAPRAGGLQEPRLALDTAEFPAVTPRVSPAQPAPPAAADATPPVIASTGARLAGAGIDLLILAFIDIVIVYFTLRICDLRPPQVLLLPLAPLLSFLALLNVGYLATFVAAGGQTIGKMAMGTRVVPADPAAPLSERVSLGQSLLRTIAYAISVLPAGLGLIPALVGRDHRALHDRLADTRVVKA